MTKKVENTDRPEVTEAAAENPPTPKKADKKKKIKAKRALFFTMDLLI